MTLLRRAHTGREAHRRRRRRPAGAARHGGRVPDRRRRNLRRDRRAVPAQDAFTIFAQAMDRTGFAAGTLAVRAGLRAPVPSPDPASRADDGGHGSWRARRNGPRPPAQASARHARSARRAHDARASRDRARLSIILPASGQSAGGHAGETPTSKLDDPGIGLRGNGRRVLDLRDLRSTFADPDGREPGRTIELHLTGHMDRFAWSFDGIKFSSPNRCAWSTASGSASSSSTTR